MTAWTTAANFVPGMVRSRLEAMPLIAAASTGSVASGCRLVISWPAEVVSPASQRGARGGDPGVGEAGVGDLQPPILVAGPGGDDRPGGML